MLLSSADVQRELGLSADKASAVQRSLNAIIDPEGVGPRDDMTLSPEQRRQKYVDRVKAVEAALEALLGQQGAKRLAAIQRQQRGVATFSDPDVVAALQLTREQRSKIALLQGEARSARLRHARDDGGGPGGPGHGGHGTNLHDRQAAIAPALNLLTPAQRALWGQLVGRPFDGYLDSPGPGGHGLGGGPGHGHGMRGDGPPVGNGFGPPHHEGPPPD
jgi:hypothetical protein